MPKYEYQSTLDDQQMLVALKRIDANMEKIAKSGSTAFNNVERSANLSAVKIGAIGGVVGALTNKFVEMGQQAVRTLENIVAGSIDVAANLESAGKIFTGVFQGNEPAAMAALERLRQASRKLGIDLIEVGKAFVPEVESLDQLEQVAKLAAGLAASQPEQGAIGARIALQEALSGNLVTLQKRFELKPESIDRIKELQKELGTTEGLLKGLEAELIRTGKDIDTLANTYQAAAGRIEQQGARFQAALGAPIVEELKETFDELGAILEERGVDFEEIAGAFGDVLANLVDFAGGELADFLTNLDTEAAIELANSFFDLVEQARILSEVLGNLGFSDNLLTDTNTLLDQLNQALITAIQISALAKAEIARREAEAAAVGFDASKIPLSAGLPGLAARLGGTIGVPLGAKIGGGEAEKARIEAAGEAAFNAVIQETIKSLEESSKRTEENTQKQRERAAALRDSNEAGKEQADSFLREQRALEAAAKALEEYKNARDKVTEAQTKFETELEQRGSDIGLDAERKRFDAMQDFAEKRAQAARKALQKIDDIERDFGRDLEDNERDRGRAFLDQAKEEAQERVDIETDFQRRLQEIRSRFGADLEEAERNRDAITFLRLQRQQQEEIEQAQTTRGQDIEDARVKGEQKRDELRTQQERENEDARIAMDRKLEDQRIAQARELEEIRFAEMIKEAEIQTWQERQFEDLKLWGLRKQEELNLQLAAELEIIKKYEEAKTQVVEEQAARRAAAAQGRGRPQTSLGSTLSPTPGSRPAAGGTPHGTVRRQAGGPVGGGVPYLVGERGPELFTPGQAGYILPNNPAITALAGQSSVVNNVSNSTTYNGNFSMLRPDALTPTQMAIVENLAVSVFRRINGG